MQELELNVNEDGRAKGSGRSVDAFNLFGALDGHRDLMTAFGGHHMAVGLTVPAAQLAALADALDQEAVNQHLADQGPSELTVAATLDVSAATMDLYHELAELAPFGTDNGQPLFAFEPESLTQIKAIGKTGDHLKFQLQSGQARLNAIQFGAGKLAPELGTAQHVAVLGTLEDNVWQGRHSLQVMVKDLKAQAPEEPTVVVERTNRLHQAMFTLPGTYVFFHKNVYQQLADRVPAGATALLYDGQPQAALAPETRVLLVDCPDLTSDLTTVIEQLKPAKITAYLYEKESLSRLGLPTRAQYAKLFKFIATHQHVDVGHQLAQLSTFIQIPRTQLIFMIQVFFECGFVSIAHGIMDGVAQPDHKDLTAAPSYQLRTQQVQTETDLLACSADELTQRLQGLIERK